MKLWPFEKRQAAAGALTTEPFETKNSNRSPAVLDIAQVLVRLRTLRADMLEPVLLQEPAWDLLLAIYVADADHVRLSVREACKAVAVPPTAALRWITILEAKELVTRELDKRDPGRVYLRLCPTAAMLVTDYLEEARSILAGLEAR